MSKGEKSSGAPSRHTNQNNSVTPIQPGNEPKSETALADPSVDVGELIDLHDRELPTPAERIAEFYERYPERADLEVTGHHGVSIRREYCHERYEEFHSEALIETEDDVTGQQLVERRAYTWGEAVEEALSSHEDTRRTTVNLEKGRPGSPEYAEFSIDATTRWFAEYQRRYYAQMKAWLREICGGERPSGGVTEAHFNDPHIALVTLSASSVPDGRVGPVDHSNKRRESWTDCYHTLRNKMRSLGFEIGDSWQYDRRAEPHTGERGGSANRCYGHDHIVIVTDGEVTPGDLRPVVEKHVESCEWAGPEAHDLDIADWDANREDVKTVEVKPADEVDNLANYVASYCGIQPVDLLERSIEYVAWAAAVNAGNVKTVSRSDAAKHAATADACKQRYESDHSDQGVAHGESVIRSERRGYDFECAKCGSPHGVDQDHDTLVSARSAAAAADGGVDRAEELRERWPSAREAATIGESPTRTRWRKQIEQFLEHNPDASPSQILGSLGLPPEARDLLSEIDHHIDRSDPVAVRRPAEWKVKSVRIGEDEYPASSGNGVDIVETRRPLQRLLDETRLGDNGAERTYWRCKRTNVAIRSGFMMACYLVKIGIIHPHVVDNVVSAERGKLSY